MKKYFLVKIDSCEDYYKCTKVYKAESEELLRNYLDEHNASDQYIVSIEEVDFENNKEEIYLRCNLICISFFSSVESSGILKSAAYFNIS